MADMFLEPIIEKLISAGLRYLKDQATWHKHTKKELEKLKEKLPQIQSVVHFASSQEQFTDRNLALNKWLWELRDAIDEADDVVDELEYKELKKQVTKIKKLRTVSSIKKFTKKKLVKIGKRALKIDPTLKKLEAIVQKLDRVSTTGIANFIDLVKNEKEGIQKQQLDLHRARETGSLPKSDLNVRVKETKLVLDWLRNPSNKPQGTDHLLYGNISLLSIVGHGGMGKTTLLQHVYKDVNKDEEMTKEFDHKMWVCVSNNFDVKKVIGDMLESLEKPRLETLDALQNTLQNELKHKKFLLVLDDVCDEEEAGRDQSKWEDVLPSLASGAFGSKILVTTRTDSIALMFARVISKKKEIVRLEGLEDDECLQLLNSHAFAGVENPSDDHHETLRAIAGQIAKKLLGSPLAAKVIGIVLNENLDEGHWRTVLKSNLLDQNSIKSILSLSYIVLSNQLRNCFAFCCMFPQDIVYDKDLLVRMWIALDFIQPSQGMTMEDIGERYLDVLVKKALIEKVRGHYKMHDLIHESASIFFAHEVGKLVDVEVSSLENSKTIRHLFVESANPDILGKIEEFKHLHSLFLFAPTDYLCNALIIISKALRSLRLLYVWAPAGLEIISEEIGNLIHLRYLKIKDDRIIMMPSSLSNLYHLRYLDLPNNSISSICGIGKLKFLQELKKFDLGTASGYRIGELENMNDLCKLEINCLENIKDDNEAFSAKLWAKSRLTNLTLRWSNDYVSKKIVFDDLEEKVLDNFRPPECLRNLVIEGFPGGRSPIWMKHVNPISNLEKIKLLNSWAWKTLPPFGQLSFLKSLKLSYMPKVKWLESKFNGNDKYRAFPLLEVLYINALDALEGLFEPGVAAEEGCLFPRLIELEIIKCPKLEKFPSLPPKLKRLHVENTGWRTLHFCSNPDPIPLESLEVINCQNIKYLPLADEVARLTALRSLSIANCPDLISLGSYRQWRTTDNCLMLCDLSISDPSLLRMEPLTSITSLKKLSIWKNDSLVSFSNLVERWFLKVGSSLSELNFSYLRSLQSLPSSLESLSSLQKLSIHDIPKLRELPSLPRSLKVIRISGCHPELKDRYRKNEGSDWHKISHIPDIYIT